LSWDFERDQSKITSIFYKVHESVERIDIKRKGFAKER
jgi:hypothetical protein